MVASLEKMKSLNIFKRAKRNQACTCGMKAMMQNLEVLDAYS